MVEPGAKSGDRSTVAYSITGSKVIVLILVETLIRAFPQEARNADEITDIPSSVR
jgi:hypothetical protein